MGFDVGRVDRVIECIISISFSVLVNGVPSQSFSPSRGIRQGDPLSPYLFILCAEALSGLLRREVVRGTIHGLRIANQAPIVSHLFFPDYSVIFVRANVEEAGRVKDVLGVYERASGQMVSFEKTKVSFSKGVGVARRAHIAVVLGVQIMDIHDRYIGLPTVVGRSKKVITKGVREMLWRKLHGWKGMILSKTGREVLIKAVSQSIPTYGMSVFKFPNAFCDEIRSLVSQFWWGQKNGERKIHWLAWSKLCGRKAIGGLGFRDCKMFSWALVNSLGECSHIWDLLLLARSYAARYFPNSSYLDSELGSNSSYTWRAIWEAR